MYFEYFVKDGKLKARLKISMYFYQLTSWLIIVIIAKLVLALFQLILADALEAFGNFVLYPVRNHGRIKLVIVMVIIPVLLNSMQFWIQDNILKLNKEVYPQLVVSKNNQLPYQKSEKNSRNLNIVNNDIYVDKEQSQNLGVLEPVPENKENLNN